MAKQTIKKPAKKPEGAVKKAPAKPPAKVSSGKAVKPVKQAEAIKKTVKSPSKSSPAVATKKPEKKAAPAKTAAPKPVPKKPTPVTKPTTKSTTKPLTPSTLTKMATTKKDLPSKPVRDMGVPGAAVVPPDYKPRDREEFMNPVMREYFRLKLLRWKAELLREAENTVHDTLQGTELQKPDLVDRASEETDHALELRTRDRERKLISKIDEALLRIEDGSYGYCEETGEPISVGRLDARPIATLSLEAQERHERKERTQRDD